MRVGEQGGMSAGGVSGGSLRSPRIPREALATHSSGSSKAAPCRSNTG